MNFKQILAIMFACTLTSITVQAAILPVPDLGDRPTTAAASAGTPLPTAEHATTLPQLAPTATPGDAVRFALMPRDEHRRNIQRLFNQILHAFHTQQTAGTPDSIRRLTPEQLAFMRELIQRMLNDGAAEDEERLYRQGIRNSYQQVAALIHAEEKQKAFEQMKHVIVAATITALLYGLLYYSKTHPIGTDFITADYKGDFLEILPAAAINHLTNLHLSQVIDCIGALAFSWDTDVHRLEIIRRQLNPLRVRELFTHLFDETPPSVKLLLSMTHTISILRLMVHHKVCDLYSWEMLGLVIAVGFLYNITDLLTNERYEAQRERIYAGMRTLFREGREHIERRLEELGVRA